MTYLAISITIKHVHAGYPESGIRNFCDQLLTISNGGSNKNSRMKQEAKISSTQIKAYPFLSSSLKSTSRNGNGIKLVSRIGVTIENCVISNFDDGIQVNNSDSNVFRNNETRENINEGFDIENSHQNTFEENNSNTNGRDGFDMAIGLRGVGLTTYLGLISGMDQRFTYG